MMEDEFVVASRNPETNETSMDFYEDEDKAKDMLEMFKEDMPERDFYLGKKA